MYNCEEELSQICKKEYSPRLSDQRVRNLLSLFPRKFGSHLCEKCRSEFELRQPPLLNQNFLDRYQNTFCVNSLCDATGICLFCYERGIHLFLQNNSYFCVFKYETKGQTKGLERGWKQRGRLGRDATTGRQYYFSCLTRPTTLTPHFTDFFTDFEKKNPTMLQSILLLFRLRTQL